jgi:hypothetical protein
MIREQMSNQLSKINTIISHYSVLSGYITTLKNKQKLVVAGVGEKARAFVLRLWKHHMTKKNKPIRWI